MKKKFLFMGLVAVSSFFTSCKKDKAVEAGDAGLVAVADTSAIAMTFDSTSTVMWEGSKPTGKHMGTIKVSGGSVSVQNGNLIAADVTLDMNSITVTDLESGEGKEDLEGHLKGTAKKEDADHFFNVAKYPTAKFALNKVTGLTGDSTATHLIYGNLTVKDVTKEVNFKANVSISPEGITLKAAPFMINRTDFGVKYASKAFFADLKDKFVNDEVAIQLDLSAKK
jgi:polyisoprenoid-binding protein YceI